MSVQNAKIDGVEYNDLSEWWVDVQGNYNNTEPYVAEGYTSSHNAGTGGTEYLSDNLGMSGLGAIPSLANNITVRAAAGQGHGGVVGNGWKVRNATNTNVINVDTDNTRIEGFTIQPSQTSNADAGIQYQSTANNFVAKDLIIELWNNTSTTDVYGIRTRINVGEIDSVLFICRQDPNDRAIAYYTSQINGNNVNLYGCGIKSGGANFRVGYSFNGTSATNLLLRNCYSLGANFDYSSNIITYADIEYCASGDDRVAGLPNCFTGLLTTAFTDYLNDDMNVVQGNQLDGAVNPGVTQPGSFTTDITGAERSAPWEIGPYELTAAGPTPPIVDAGGPYSGIVGTPIALDSASVSAGSDPSPTLLWSIVSGGTGSFSDTSIVNPTFTPDSEGQYVLRLSADPDDGDPVTNDTTLDSNAAALDVTFDGPNIVAQSGQEDSVFTFNENGQGTVASRFSNATFYELSPLSNPLPASLTVNPTTGNIEGTLDAATAGDYPGILIRGSISETMTVGNNAGFIYGYRNDAGDVFGSLTGDILEGVQIIRAQVNTSGNIIFVRFFGSVQLPGVNLLRWASDNGNFVDLPWDGGNGDYRSVDADFTAFIFANDGLSVGCRIYKAD